MAPYVLPEGGSENKVDGLYCPRCEVPIPWSSNFCRGCGLRLTWHPVSSDASTPPSPIDQGLPNRPDSGSRELKPVLKLLLGALGALIMGLFALVPMGLAWLPSRLADSEAAQFDDSVLWHDAAAGTFLPAPSAPGPRLELTEVIEIAEKVTVLVLSDYGSCTCSGSGVVVRSDGYILTNRHVIEGKGRYSVQFSEGAIFPATLSWVSEDHDLALLKVENSGFMAAELADSDLAKPGEEVVAAGYPLADELGEGPTMTRGMVSAVRTLSDGETYLQTDAPVNPGNSGGPLFNLRGQVIGINTQRLQGVFFQSIVGISLAIPINTARDIIPGSVGAQ